MNILSGVPSETCPSETLIVGDVLHGVTFGLVGWRVETINGSDVGVFCNSGGDDGGGINEYSTFRTETIGVSVADVPMVFVGCGILIIGGGGGKTITGVEMGGVIFGVGNESGSDIIG